MSADVAEALSKRLQWSFFAEIWSFISSSLRDPPPVSRHSYRHHRHHRHLLDPPPVSRRGAPRGAAQPPLLGGSSAGPRHCCQQAGRGGWAGLLAHPQPPQFTLS